jgi:parvulin-like peptidyl-prolyl isomerase
MLFWSWTAPVLAQEPLTPADATGLVLERVLVNVNGDIVTQTDLESRQIDAIRSRGVQPTSEVELSQLLLEITPEVISTAVDELLMVQKARELGYHMSDEQFAEMVSDIMVENNFGEEEEFHQALQDQNGMSIEDFRRGMERQMLVNQIQQIEIMSKVTLTQTEARQYYDENLAEFTDPPTVTMREILVRVTPGIGGTVNAFADGLAETKIEEARQRILDGEDFGLVAVAMSDAASKANGGLVGPLDLVFINEAVAEILIGMEVGELSPAIRTAAGYQMFELVEFTESQPRPFGEVRDQIGNSVFSERRVAEYLSYLDGLREEADIVWRDEQAQSAFDSFTGQRATRIGRSSTQ